MDMKEFVFEAPVKVYFGENGVEKHLANLLKNVGSTVMLAYGGGSIKKNGLYDQLMRILKEIGKRVVEFGGIGSNPTYAKVLEGAALINKESVDFVLAVGGGSVIDCMKVAVAAAKAPTPTVTMEWHWQSSTPATTAISIKTGRNNLLPLERMCLIWLPLARPRWSWRVKQ